MRISATSVHRTKVHLLTSIGFNWTIADSFSTYFLGNPYIRPLVFFPSSSFALRSFPQVKNPLCCRLFCQIFSWFPYPVSHPSSSKMSPTEKLPLHIYIRLAKHFFRSRTLYFIADPGPPLCDVLPPAVVSPLPGAFICRHLFGQTTSSG